MSVCCARKLLTEGVMVSRFYKPYRIFWDAPVALTQATDIFGRVTCLVRRDEQVDGRRWRQRLRQSKSKLVNLRAALWEGAAWTQGPWMAVGEEAVVHIELYNPLQTQLQLDQVTLSLCLTPSRRAEDREAPDRSAEDGVVARAEECAGALQDGRVTVERKDLSLAAGGRYVVAIRMTALEPGTILVKGLEWRLAGVVRCVHSLQLRGRRLHATMAQRCSDEGVYEPDRRAYIRVLPAMPRLSLELLGLPARALRGQVNRWGLAACLRRAAGKWGCLSAGCVRRAALRWAVRARLRWGCAR